jgi:hypothetical protein
MALRWTRPLTPLGVGPSKHQTAQAFCVGGCQPRQLAQRRAWVVGAPAGFQAWAARVAWVRSRVLSGAQSKNVCPRPFAWAIGHVPSLQQLVPPGQQVFVGDPQPPIGPAGQVHVPDSHVAAFAQAWQVGPQCCSSVAWFTQVSPQMSGSDVGHRQLPDSQTSFVSGQAAPHAPQFAGSFWRFTHAVGVTTGHCVGREAGHAQVPPWQIASASWQALPQAVASGPQLFGSVSVSVQSVPQSSSFGARQAHALLVQVAPGLHGVVQDPHACSSEVRSRQRGSRPAQSVALPHWHTPPAHTALTPALDSPHPIPHPPQLFASAWNVAGSTHTPPHRTWLEGQLGGPSRSGAEVHPARTRPSASAAAARVRAMGP